MHMIWIEIRLPQFGNPRLFIVRISGTPRCSARCCGHTLMVVVRIVVKAFLTMVAKQASIHFPAIDEKMSHV